MPVNCLKMLNALVLVQMFNSPLLHQPDIHQLKKKEKEESFLFGHVTNRAGPREDELNSAPATAHFSPGQELCALAIMGFFYLQKKWKRICGLTDVPLWPFSLENLSSNITEH